MNNKAMLPLTLLIVTTGFPRTGLLATEPLPPRALARIGDHRFYHGPGITCAVLSPDGSRVASAARYPNPDCVTDKEREAYDPVIVLWDVATGERLRELRVPKGAISRLAFSPTGKRLAADYAISDEKFGVVLFSVETGKLLRPLGDFPREIGCLQFSADGKQLRVSEWGGPVSAWDAATGKQLRLWKPPPSTPSGKDKAGMSAVQGVLSPDGRVIVWEMCGYAGGGCPSSWMDGLRVHDAETNKPLYQKKFIDQDQESEHDEFMWSFAFTSDSKRLVADCDKLAVWEATTGRELATFKVPRMLCFTLAPDGRRAAIEEAVTRGEKSRLRLWDIEAGKPLRELCPSFEDSAYGFRWRTPVFSANGKTLLLATDSTLRLFDAETGEERTVPGHRAPVAPRFSADGRMLFTTCAERRCRWNVSGKEPTLLGNEPRKAEEVECPAQINPEKTSTSAELTCQACSPDGRLLAVAEKYSGTIRLLEIASGKTRAEFNGHRHGIHGLAFSPDGRTLASGGEDNVVFLWDVIGARTPTAVKKALAAWWSDLASEDGKRAGNAIAGLLRKSETSVAFLQHRLRPAEVPDAEHLTRLLADLDSDVFDKRAAATRELAQFGEQAETVLRQALKDRPSLEARRRIEDLLGNLERGQLPPETLRTLRVIEILEHLGTPEARRCLDALAKGAPAARQTREAKTALDRLAKRR